uniref:Uncharacterized protein n=1 Tax=viral metagenome TaxID=1070528 RepID=A0A6C0EP63_9ZZZZ
MKERWIQIVPSSPSNLEKNKKQLKLPHKLGYIPKYLKSHVKLI